MKLSEYRKELEKIARRLKRQGIDPEICIGLHSDVTTNVTDNGTFPRVVRGLPHAGDEWVSLEHPTMNEETRAKLKTYVELAIGN